MSEGKSESWKKNRSHLSVSHSNTVQRLPRVGAAAKFVDIHDRSYEGRVQVINQLDELVVLEETNDHGSCTVCVLNYKHCTKFEELHADIEPLKPLRKLDIAKIQERKQKAIKHLANLNYMRENKNITEEGISAFNSLCTIFNEDIIHWEDLNIVVNDTVRICPPYNDSSVERITDGLSKVSEDTFKRICMLLNKRTSSRKPELPVQADSVSLNIIDTPAKSTSS